jgi:hypothetical protein
MSAPRWPDDPDVARAWDAFARADTTVVPPADLEARVLRSAAQRHTAPVLRGWSLVPVAALAAAAVVVGVFVWNRPTERTTDRAPTVAPAAIAEAPPPVAASAPVAPDVVAPARSDTAGSRPRAAVDRGRPAPGRSAVAASAPEPFDGALQVVRVRIDAAALGGLGIRVLGQPPVGPVEVDLVVGEDGWPREVRRIRRAMDPAMPN